MKTKLIVEIETKDDYNVWEDWEKQPEDYTEEELQSYRKKYAKGLHKSVIEYVKRVLRDDLEDNFMDSSFVEEYMIEGWEDFEDYGIKIKASQK